MLNMSGKVDSRVSRVVTMFARVQLRLAAGLLVSVAELLGVKDLGAMLARARAWLETVASLEQVLS
jgi:hypothetical protein